MRVYSDVSTTKTYIHVLSFLAAGTPTLSLQSIIGQTQDYGPKSYSGTARVHSGVRPTATRSISPNIKDLLSFSNPTACKLVWGYAASTLA
jgi:hypothetical protein